MVLSTSGRKIYDDGRQVYLKGMGLVGFCPNLILWGPGGSDNWGDQFTTGDAMLYNMNETFRELSQNWNVNMIRVFIYPEWWMQDNIIPAVVSGVSQYGMAPISTREFMKTLLTVAGNYGIYVDIVVYELTAGAGAYGGDPYRSEGAGLPLSGQYGSAESAYLQSTGMSEETFWHEFWMSMAQSLGRYPNAIFEAWNEAGNSSGGVQQNVVDAGFLRYLQIMYEAVRSAGATNLIMMQWQAGWLPNGWGLDCSAAKQIVNALGGNPTNWCYTTHVYYYSPSDITQYWNSNGVKNGEGGVPFTKDQLVYMFTQLWASMGVDYPLVFNEAGDCPAHTVNISNDYVWWDNVCKSTYEVGIGLCAYYWARMNSHGGLGFHDEGLIESAPYLPNTFGYSFILDSTIIVTPINPPINPPVNPPVNPPLEVAPVAQSGHLGYDVVGSVSDGGADGGWFIATRIVAVEDGVIKDLNLYVSNGKTGNAVDLALYSDNGSGTFPNGLLSHVVVPWVIDGWQTGLINNVPVTKGSTYWLCFNMNNSNMICFGGNGALDYYELQPYGVWPTSPTGPYSYAHWRSFYGTYASGPNPNPNPQQQPTKWGSALMLVGLGNMIYYFRILRNRIIPKYVHKAIHPWL